MHQLHQSMNQQSTIQLTNQRIELDWIDVLIPMNNQRQVNQCIDQTSEMNNVADNERTDLLLIQTESNWIQQNESMNWTKHWTDDSNDGSTTNQTESNESIPMNESTNRFELNQRINQLWLNESNWSMNKPLRLNETQRSTQINESPRSNQNQWRITSTLNRRARSPHGLAISSRHQLWFASGLPQQAHDGTALNRRRPHFALPSTGAGGAGPRYQV